MSALDTPGSAKVAMSAPLDASLLEENMLRRPLELRLYNMVPLMDAVSSPFMAPFTLGASSFLALFRYLCCLEDLSWRRLVM